MFGLFALEGLLGCDLTGQSTYNSRLQTSPELSYPSISPLTTHQQFHFILSLFFYLTTHREDLKTSSRMIPATRFYWPHVTLLQVQGSLQAQLATMYTHTDSNHRAELYPS